MPTTGFPSSPKKSAFSTVLSLFISIPHFGVSRKAPAGPGVRQEIYRHDVQGFIAVNWDEVRRLANLKEYRNLPECEALVQEVANELKSKNPLHPD